jgi:hypothetical protein
MSRLHLNLEFFFLPPIPPSGAEAAIPIPDGYWDRGSRGEGGRFQFHGLPLLY